MQPGSIPLTTSGKVRRRDCLQLYLRDEFTRMDGPIRAPQQQTVDDTGAGAEADSGLAQRLAHTRASSNMTCWWGGLLARGSGVGPSQP